MAITKKKKSNMGVFIGIALTLVALVLVSTQVMVNAGDTSSYQSTTVNKETIETYYTFTGSVGSKKMQNVMAEKIMQISEIKVSEGTKVKKEDVLFIDSDGTEVKAKIDGTVSKIHIEVDEQVMSGSLLCELYDFDNLQVSVRVDEYDLSAIQAGDTIDVTINALDKEISGTVVSVSDTAVNQNGVAFFTATVDLDKDSDVKVGMTAEAKILNEQATDVLTISMKALMFDSENNPYIYTKGDNNVMTKTAVIVGINDGKTVEIINGVRQGQTVYYTNDLTETSSGGFAPPMPGR